MVGRREGGGEMAFQGAEIEDGRRWSSEEDELPHIMLGLASQVLDEERETVAQATESKKEDSSPCLNERGSLGPTRVESTRQEEQESTIDLAVLEFLKSEDDGERGTDKRHSSSIFKDDLLITMAEPVRFSALELTVESTFSEITSPPPEPSTREERNLLSTGIDTAASHSTVEPPSSDSSNDKKTVWKPYPRKQDSHKTPCAPNLEQSRPLPLFTGPSVKDRIKLFSQVTSDNTM